LGGGTNKSYVVEEALKAVFKRDRGFSKNGDQYDDCHDG
jgi:hypothetical protein